MVDFGINVDHFLSRPEPCVGQTRLDQGQDQLYLRVTSLGAFAAAPPPWGNWTFSPRIVAPAPRGSQDTAASGFAWQPSFPHSDPLPPGNAAAYHRAAQLRVVESRARDPPLFVAVSNGRIQNIGGCPGDSVICHRITFENGTWNEATADAAPTALCSNEASWPEVGPRAPRARAP